MTAPKLLTYTLAGQAAGEARAGLLIDGKVRDASLVFQAQGQPAARLTMLQLLEDWPATWQAIQRYADSPQARDDATVALDAVTILAPVSYPGTIYCAGANYSDHIQEMARASGIPATSPRDVGNPPWHFIKPSRSCVVAHGDVVARPPGSEKLDWEAELAVVIGRKARNVSVDDALDYVAGYTIANDLSARDLGRRTMVPQGTPFHYDWMAHKGFEGSCPLGPWITPAIDIADPQALGMKLWVNDALMQDSNTSQMIYGVAEQIAHLSKTLTLHPGDVILTGTPAGVGAGRNKFLQPGDQVRVTIDQLGTLDTTIGASA